MIEILAFIFVFGVLVFVHELGHFLAARTFGVRVEEFAFGFPPRIWGKKRGDTTYAINLIPFGGYVKMTGEEGDGKKNDPKNFQSKKGWQKVIILSAGVLMNLLLAYGLLVGFYAFGGKALLPGMGEHKFVENTQAVLVSEVVPDSPAEKAGITSGTIIKMVDGKEVFSTQEGFAAIQSVTEGKDGASVELVISKNGDIKTITVGTYPEKVESNGNITEYQRIGITMEDTGKIQSKIWAAPVVAAAETFRLTKMTLTSLGDVFVESIKNLKLSDQLGGPVAIFMVTGTAAKMGMSTLLQVIIILSLTLAIINIMPFPALDGGHILFIGLEKILGREIPDKIKRTVNLIGFCLLLLLIVLISIKDLGRFGIFQTVKEWF